VARKKLPLEADDRQMADNPNELTRLHAFINGRVQGVGFRFFVIEKADLLQVTGWVRNTYDGQVEVTAEGLRPVLERFLVYLRHGPQVAYVTEVQTSWQQASGEFSRFEIAPSE
jgi:acylphosphatase